MILFNFQKLTESRHYSHCNQICRYWCQRNYLNKTKDSFYLISHFYMWILNQTNFQCQNQNYTAICLVRAIFSLCHFLIWLSNSTSMVLVGISLLVNLFLLISPLLYFRWKGTKYLQWFYDFLNSKCIASTHLSATDISKVHL